MIRRKADLPVKKTRLRGTKEKCIDRGEHDDNIQPGLACAMACDQFFAMRPLNAVEGGGWLAEMRCNHTQWVKSLFWILQPWSCLS